MALNCHIRNAGQSRVTFKIYLNWITLKSSSSDSTLRNQSVADLNQSEDEFWIENDRNTSSCDSQLSLGWSSAGGTDVR